MTLIKFPTRERVPTRDSFDELCLEIEKAERSARQLRRIIEERRALKCSWMVVLIWAIALAVITTCTRAHAQGIYMGRDGRAHAQVIVGPDGRGWPVAPTFCTPGFGPCPVVLGPPGYGPSPLVPPLGYGPPPPPVPLGWVWGRYTACIEPDCRSVIVSVGADGLNVRTAPGGPIVLTLANGVPVIPLQREGDWLLVAAACPLVPTFTASITAGGIPLSICGGW